MWPVRRFLRKKGPSGVISCTDCWRRLTDAPSLASAIDGEHYVKGLLNIPIVDI